MDSMPPLSRHALKRWNERCADLNPEQEWYRVRRAGKKTKQRIRDACPAHAKYMTGRTYRGFWYGISPNRIVFVIKGGNEKVVTVFRLP